MSSPLVPFNTKLPRNCQRAKPHLFVQIIRDHVEHLYDVHDHFYTTDKKAKTELLNRIQADILTAISAQVTTSWEPPEKAQLHFLHGKALDIQKDFNLDAETHLIRAVKLDPLCWDAWNCLGSVYYKKKDLRASLDAFDNSAAAKPNFVAFRDASIVLRQIPDRSTASDNIR